MFKVGVEEATIADLDEQALRVAREKFKARNLKAPWYDEINSWGSREFLDKAKMTANGKLTRASILLLGKETAAHFLSPHPVQIVWNLDAPETAYNHFGPPFFLTTTQVLQCIRNVPQKLFPSNQLMPVEVPKRSTLSFSEFRFEQDPTNRGRMFSIV